MVNKLNNYNDAFFKNFDSKDIDEISNGDLNSSVTNYFKSINGLPLNIWDKIFSHCNVEDLSRLRLTSKGFQWLTDQFLCKMPINGVPDALAPTIWHDQPIGAVPALQPSTVQSKQVKIVLEKKDLLTQSDIIYRDENGNEIAALLFDGHKYSFRTNQSNIHIECKEVCLEKDFFFAEAKARLTVSGSLQSTAKVFFHCKQFSVEGDIKARICLIQTKDYADQKNVRIHSDLLSIFANRISLSGQYDCYQAWLTASTVDILEGCDLKIGFLLSIAATKIIVRASSITCDNLAAFKTEHFEAAEKAHFVTNSLKIESLTAKFKDVHIKAKHCLLQTEESLKIGKNSSCEIEQLNIACGDLSFSGCLKNCQQAIILAKNNVKIGNEAWIGTKEFLHIYAKNKLWVLGTLSGYKQITEAEPFGHIYLQAKDFWVAYPGRIGCYSLVIECEESCRICDSGCIQVDSQLIVHSKVIKSEGNVHCTGIGLLKAASVHLLHGSCTDAYAALKIEAETLTLTQASVKSRRLHLESANSIVMDESTLYSSGPLAIESKLLKSAGQIRGKDIYFNVNDVSLHGGNITAFNSMKIEASNVFVNQFLTVKNIEISCSAKLLVGERGAIESDNYLGCSVLELMNRGRILSKNTLVIDAKATVVNALSASITLSLENNEQTNAVMQIKAESFWNTGTVNSANRLIFSLNRLFVNGYTEWSTLSESASGCVLAKVQAKSLHVVAPAFISIGASLIAEDLKASSFLQILLCPIVSWQTNTNALLSVQAGINVPHIGKLGSYLKSLASFDFGNFCQAINTENIMTSTGIFLSLLKMVAPGIGSGMNLAWNLVLFVVQFYSIKEAYQQLQKSKRPIELRDVIPLVVACKGLLVESANLYSQAQNFKTQFWDQSEEGSYPAKQAGVKQVAFKVAEAALLTFAPNNTHDALASIYLPSVNLTCSSQSTSLWNLTTPQHTEAACLVVKSFYRAQLLGNNLCENLALNGRKLTLGGKNVVQSANISVGTLVVATNQNLHNTYIGAEKIQQKADLILEGASQVMAGKHVVGKDVQFELANDRQGFGVDYQSKHTEVYGKATLSETRVQVQNFAVKEGGNATFHRDTVSISHLTQEQKSALRFLASQDIHIDQGIIQSKTDVQESHMSFTEMNVQNGHLQFAENSLAQGEKLHIQGGKVAVDGGAELYARELRGDSTAVLQVKEAKTTFSDFNYEGSLLLNQAQVDFENDTKLENFPKIQINNSRIHSERNLALDGSFELIGASSISADNNLDLAPTTSFSGDQGSVLLKSEGGKIAGSFTAKDLFLETNASLDYIDLLNGRGSYSKIQPSGILSYKTNKAITINESINRSLNLKLTCQSAQIHADCSANGFYVKTSQGDLNAAANLHANALLLDAAQNLTTGNYAYSSELLHFKANGNYTHAKGEVYSKEALIEANGQINNIAGKIKASAFLQLDGGEVHAVCDEQYQSAQFIGGTGEGHEKVGLVVKGDMLVNDASQFKSDGHAYYFTQTGGFHATARTHDAHGRKLPQAQQPLFESTEGKIFIFGNGGQIHTESAIFNTRSGTEVHNKNGNIHFTDKVITTTETKKKWRFPFSRKKTTQVHEHSLPTEFISHEKGGTRFATLETGDIDCIGVKMDCPGTTIFDSAGRTNIKARTLQHKITEKSTNLGFSFFGIQLFGEGERTPFIKPDPAYVSLNRLFHSQSVPEGTFNALNSGKELIDLTNQLGDAIDTGEPLKPLAERYAGLSFKPKAEFDLSRSKKQETFQSIGEGEIVTDDLILLSRQKALIEGVPVLAAHNMKVRAPEFTTKGIPLDYELKTREASCKTTFTPKSALPDLTVGRTNTQVKGKQYAQQQLFVEGNMDIQAEIWDITDAAAHVGSLTGKVDVVQITTHTNEYKSRSIHKAIGTDTTIACQTNTIDQIYIDKQAQLNVREPLTPDFKVNQIYLRGANIFSEKTVNVNPSIVRTWDIKTHSQSKSRGIGIHALEQYNYINSLNEPQSGLKAIPIHFSNSKESQDWQSGIYGKEGTGQVEGLIKKHKKSTTYTGSLVLPTKKNWQKVASAFDRCTGHVKKEPKTDRLYNKIGEIFQTHDKEALKMEINNGYLASSMVYNEDLGKEAAGKNGWRIAENGIYENTSNDTRIVLYEDRLRKQAIFAVRGTASVKYAATVDMEIALGLTMKSIENDACDKFLQENIKDFRDKGYKIMVAAHSGGASQGGIISSKYDLPAIVFDNPGLPAGRYDLSRVISFQSLRNAVNGFPKTTKDGYEYGNVWLLPEKPKDTLFSTALATAARFPLAQVPAVMGHLYTTHNLDSIGERLQSTLAMDE